MTRVLVITRGFPYGSAEQFVEPEAPWWRREGVEVVVMPWRADGTARPLPGGITVDHTLARITPRQRQLARARALATPLFWREVGWLARHRRLGRGTAQEVLRGVGGALAMRDALAGWLQANGPVDVAYTYWWDVWTYAAQLLRGRGIGHVVSRAHGYDLYESRTRSGFHSLKRSLGPQLDRLLVISREGERTAVEDYGLDPSRVELSPLGVVIPDSMAATSPEGELHLVSTASMSQVKRLDRMVNAVGLLAVEHPELQVHWTHFGDGGLRDELQRQLDAGPRPANLHVAWPGVVDNDELRRHFGTAPVDLFVNTSASEGVPVSIMEAMAFGVPSLAPAVGGIGDLVPAGGSEGGARGGELLGSAPDGREVADALWRWRELAKQPAQREAARSIAATGYDQARNYPAVMDTLVALAG